MPAFELRDAVTPSTEDTRIARENSRALSSLGERSDRPLRVKVMNADDGEEVTIPAAAFKALGRILELMAEGNAVALVPSRAELTTQEAAALLNVSRPFVVKLIKTGELACRMVGTHRRVAFKDLMEYKARMAKVQEAAMDELVAEAQELDLGYRT